MGRLKRLKIQQRKPAFQECGPQFTKDVILIRDQTAHCTCQGEMVVTRD